MMLRDKLNFNMFVKNLLVFGFSTESILTQKLQKSAIIMLICFSAALFFAGNMQADSHNNQLQKYIINAKNIEANKRKARVAAQKTNGRTIKYYLKKKSVARSKKGKAKTAAVKMVDAGLITASMVKKNRWFVQKPYQTSYTKISSIKQYQPPPINPEENNKISRQALLISKTRARDTGPVKPDSLYSGESSRNVWKMTKTRARVAGPAKTGIVYTESTSRAALKLSKARAQATGPVKPASLYSESVSRNAMEMTNKRAKKFTAVRIGLVYSAELLKSMGRRPPIKNTPFKVEPSNANKKVKNNAGS